MATRRTHQPPTGKKRARARPGPPGYRARARRPYGVGANNAEQKKNGNGGGNRSSFWAGMLMGAATATGGFFAIRALEKVFKKKDEAQAQQNPSPVQQRLVASATGQIGPNAGTALLAPAKPPVVKRTVIEEMVEDLD